jgi:hypothetical protein
MTGVRSLSWKLGGALLLMVVISVGLMAYITNRSTTEDFRQYVAHGGMMHARSVERALSQLYIQEEGWSDLRRTLDNLLTSENERLMVTDSSGIVIGDTARQWLGRNAIEAGLTGGVPIIVSGEEVGELYLLSFEGMMGMGHMGGRGNPPAAVFDVAEQDFLIRRRRAGFPQPFQPLAVAGRTYCRGSGTAAGTGSDPPGYASASRSNQGSQRDSQRRARPPGQGELPRRARQPGGLLQCHGEQPGAK